MTRYPETIPSNEFDFADEEIAMNLTHSSETTSLEGMTWQVSLRLPASLEFAVVVDRIRTFLEDHGVLFSERTELDVLVVFRIEAPLADARRLASALGYIATIESLYGDDAYVLTLLPKDIA